MIIKSLIDQDFYKLSMGQMAFHQYFGAKVKYRFVCRNKDVNLSPYIDEIKEEIDKLFSLRFQDDEIEYLKNVHNGIFKQDYLDYLRTFSLKKEEINVFIKDNQLNIEAEGEWQSAIFWEIFVLSIVNEVYFRNTQPNVDYNVGRSKLADKINLVKRINKEKNKFSFIEFGTRRRFSQTWQEEVTMSLKNELTGRGFVGTSNVYLAKKLNIPVIGTIAHEAFQAIQGLNFQESVSFVSSNPATSYFMSQENTLRAWLKEYNGKLTIALSDIFGTDAFLSVLDQELTQTYDGLRHDSGSPFVWADKVLAHYKKMNVDAKTKSLVFSDGLDFPKAEAIMNYVGDQSKVVFGIGTNLTNDFDHKALNIVMKMVEAGGRPVVKISDEPTKAIGDQRVIDAVKKHFNIKDA